MPKGQAEPLIVATVGLVTLVGAAVVAYWDSPIGSTGVSRQKINRIPGALPIVGDALTVAAKMDTFHDFSSGKLGISRSMAPSGITKFHVFDKGPRFQGVFLDFLGHGIFNSDGERWKNQRKLAANIFNVKNFKDFVSDVFVHEMELFGDVLQAHAQRGDTVDLQDLFYRFTFDSFTRIAFGIEMDTICDGKKAPFMVAFDEVQARTAKRFLTPLWEVSEFCNGQSRVHARQISEIRDFGRSIIAKKRENEAAGVAQSESDLLSLLMKVKDEEGKLPGDDLLVDYALNFLLAGRDTTATLLTWSILLLHQHPETLIKLRDEISNLSEGSTPTYEQIRTELPYANAVLHETLRLYPSVPQNMKQANADETLPDGTFVPKGSSVGWNTYAMGRTEAIWGPDAKEYRPERWLEMEKQPSTFDYPVFHAGPRVCLGKSMAELEGVFVLAEVLRKFEFEVLDVKDAAYSLSILLPKKNGLKVRVTERK
ncbi:cytochrome P450 [Chytriomyces sp. MP71]|nr:cytochrome P450 [Chytriomyces sp. MP71]